ncbi:hypothetical protein ATCCBAA256_11080 [Mycobacterium montefiorense]|nr:hypothetical protein ATCCBAA256_11080 [Mycobacterium montefiorense]
MSNPGTSASMQGESHTNSHHPAAISAQAAVIAVRAWVAVSEAIDTRDARGSCCPKCSGKADVRLAEAVVGGAEAGKREGGRGPYSDKSRCGKER